MKLKGGAVGLQEGLYSRLFDESCSRLDRDRRLTAYRIRKIIPPAMSVVRNSNTRTDGLTFSSMFLEPDVVSIFA